MDFVSVERVVELLHVEQEPPGTVDPPVWWPSLAGDIIFENVTIRYAPHLDPSLSDLSFTIKGGSSTAIIGRTATDIQQILREQMKGSTVITIAHRLEAVKHADYCIVLGQGKLVKQGPAAEMLGTGQTMQ
ncbi:hypothetical protein LTR28_004669 [Elasticomyces elasticus]|nr:hypothetical protein LTR28_004669 [Elasticomyces elasticus]